MTEKELQLHEQIAEMQGDFRTMAKSFLALLEGFGLKPEDLSGGQMQIMSKLPGLLNKLMVQVATGQFDQSAFDQVSALQPIFEKYKPLLDDLNISDEQ